MILIKIDNDYFGNSQDDYLEDINNLVSELDIYCTIKNNNFHNIVQGGEDQDWDKSITVSAKGYSQGEWQDYTIYYNNDTKELSQLVEQLKKTFTHKNDYSVNKYEVVKVGKREYTSEAYDYTAFTITNIEFPDKEDIITEYQSIYGKDYDRLEFNLN